MLKKFLLCLCVAGMIFSVAQASFSQENDIAKISGKVQEIGANSDYIMVDGTKYMISEDIKDFLNMENGDQVELYLQKTEEGTVVVDFDYL